MRHLWPIRDRLEAAQNAQNTQTQAAQSTIPSCAAFIHDYVRIDNAQPDDDEAPEAIPFHLWDAQRDLLSDIISVQLLLILKARQLGISWLVCAYALWLCLYHPGRLALFFSIGQKEANEMMRRMSAMYWRMPVGLRAVLPALETDNTEEMRWSNGSAIQSLPSRQTAGSGYTASIIVLDEFAKNPNARALYTAVKPTIDGGGKMVILSSAQGADNLFYDLVTKARKTLGRFVFRFLPWDARPGRDAAWYAAVAADAIDESHMKQEYPATPDEAFEATEVNAFLANRALWDACYVEMPPLDAREPLVVAADAGETDDTFALVAVGAMPGDRTRVAVRWCMVFYPGPNGIDYIQVQTVLLDFCKTHAVLQVCFDRYQLRLMMQQLGQQGVWCEVFSQSGDRLEADKMLRDLTQSRTLAQNGDLVLTEHIMNANVKNESNGGIRLIKREHTKKIDAAVTLSMACHRLLTEFQL